MKRCRQNERRYRPFTPEQRYWLCEYAKGMTAQEVAARLGITVGMVYDWAKQARCQKSLRKRERIPPDDPRRCKRCGALRDKVAGSNDELCGLCILDDQDIKSGKRAARVEHLEIVLDFLERSIE